MGYYSKFEIEVTPPLDLDRITDTYYIPLYAGYGEANEIKWYNHKSDMLMASLRYPGHVFIMTRSGEECDDIEFTYYKAGQMYSIKPNLMPPPFDPSKLSGTRRMEN